MTIPAQRLTLVLALATAFAAPAAGQMRPVPGGGLGGGYRGPTGGDFGAPRPGGDLKTQPNSPDGLRSTTPNVNRPDVANPNGANPNGVSSGEPDQSASESSGVDPAAVAQAAVDQVLADLPVVKKRTAGQRP